MSKYQVEYDVYGFSEMFACEADNSKHAKEQCENAYPDCVVIMVYALVPC